MTKYLSTQIAFNKWQTDNFFRRSDPHNQRHKHGRKCFWTTDFRSVFDISVLETCKTLVYFHQSSCNFIKPQKHF